MLNIDFYFKFLAWSEGKALPAVLSERLGLSDPTCRMPLDSELSENARRRSQAFAEEREEEALLQKGLSANEAVDWVEQHPRNRVSIACYSTLVYEAQSGNSIKYPLTLALTLKIDEFYSVLNSKREENDLEGFKEVLLLHKQYFGVISRRKLEVERQIEVATSWDILKAPLARVSVGCLFSFLAMWDIEFGAKVYFPNFEPRSVFAMTLPSLSDKAERVNGVLEKRRDMFRYPVRRLIELMACIRLSDQEHSKVNVKTTVRDMALKANIPEQNFINWRDGTKKFTRRDFEGLWKGLYSADTRFGKVPYAPWPLFVATIFWQNMLVSIDVSSRERSIVVGDAEYLQWWQWHFEELKAKGGNFGTTPWPECINKI